MSLVTGDARIHEGRGLLKEAWPSDVGCQSHPLVAFRDITEHWPCTRKVTGCRASPVLTVKGVDCYYGIFNSQGLFG